MQERNEERKNKNWVGTRASDGYKCTSKSVSATKTHLRKRNMDQIKKDRKNSEKKYQK